MVAENDLLSPGARACFDAPTCPKRLITFTVAEGGGDHREMMNRSLVNRAMRDWLDGVLA
jgi:hypothetical protein